jgi:hypothetical protein
MPANNPLILGAVEYRAPGLVRGINMEKKTKVEEKVSVKDKLLGGKEVKEVEQKESEDLLGRKKVEQTVTKKKI